MAQSRPPAPHEESPVNPIPGVVVLLFLAVIGPEIAFTFGARGLIGGPDAVGWRLAAIQQFGFSADVFRWMIGNGRFPPEHLLRFVSYPFVHGAFTTALFAGVMLLALGKFVGELLRPAAVLTLFVTASVAGAVVHGAVMVTQPWLIGAFPGVYGLIGGFTFLLWVRLAGSGRAASAFSLIGMLLGLQLLFGLAFGSDGLWLAELVGFATGFALTVLLVPGGWARVLVRLRGRG